MAVEDGALYVVGDTQSQDEGKDVFLLKLNSEGQILWNTTWGGKESEWAHGIAAEGGNIYVVGDIFETGDVFLLKYDSDGELVWNITSAHPHGWKSIARGVAVRGDAVYIAVSRDLYCYLLKFDPDCQMEWNSSWSTGGEFIVRDIAFEEETIYVAGHIRFWHLAEDREVTLLSFDPSGKVRWEASWGLESSDERVWGIDAKNGMVYVAGDTRVRGASNSDLFLLKYDSEGNLRWNVTWGRPGYDWMFDVGLMENRIFVGGDTRSGEWPLDVLVDIFDLNGAYMGNFTWGGRGSDYTMSVASNGETVYLVGLTSSYGAGLSDAFILALQPYIERDIGRERLPFGLEIRFYTTVMIVFGITTVLIILVKISKQ